MRKPRSDRNHIIYQLTNTLTNETYIGITVVRGQAYNKSLKLRFEGHCYKAFIEQKDWTLSHSIRTYGTQAFTKHILEVVRGKSTAHQKETSLINSLHPALNTKKITNILDCNPSTC